MKKLFTEDRWWLKKGDEHEEVWPLVRRIVDDLGDLPDRNERYLSLYCNRSISLGGGHLSQAEVRHVEHVLGVSLNIIQSAIDTLAARIASSRPRPQFLTADGDWSLRQKAKKLQKFVEGVFYEADFYAEAARVFVDACVFGTGFLKVFPAHDRVCCERVYPGEIIVDEGACAFSRPRAMYQKKMVPAEVLAALFPKHVDVIGECLGEGVIQRDRVVYHDLVEVIEGWHLPSGPEAKDGKHIICVEKGTLLAEPYKFDYFPFAELRYTTKPYGYYGMGLAEQLEGVQIELNKLLGRIQDAMHLFAVPIAWVPQGSVDRGKLSNMPGAIVEYDPRKGIPQISMPPAVASQVFDHVWQLYNRAYEICGVSQLSAQSRRPAGIESGVALRTLQEVETQRFALTFRQWEGFALQAARYTVDLAKDLYADGGKVKWRGKSYVEEIDWSDVDMDRDRYVLQLFPTSMLPKEPAGRLQFVQDLIGGNMISPEEGASLLEFPDLERYQSLGNAAVEQLDMVFDTMMNSGDYIPPHRLQNLQLGLSKAHAYWLRESMAGAPEDRLALLEQWVTDAQELMMPPAPPESVPEMPGGAPPEGMPPEMAGGEAAPPMALPS